MFLQFLAKLATLFIQEKDVQLNVDENDSANWNFYFQVAVEHLFIRFSQANEECRSLEISTESLQRARVRFACNL